ncbi:unnamed protein product [Tilletia controversa]|uniref:Uncharacterized protein n=3 Tax=Tilletia TaxID=13289 RepID=A0A8X7SWQ3_9BASI|nr:hypothetical protein CF336_g7825 [Tilletia laevis]KAE8202663.1 hypothetical protein CF328_g2090 [Tilletia controversa]KAE8242875.1 hypothetical protein A4X03_0g7936 [Tilletia caries]KAE8184436.1 hypothetical protein CF335_g8021 [Tilletia laevis]KAE8246968.1 hypothetical protein A4X06_0g4792 [Tilletia controversa]
MNWRNLVALLFVASSASLVQARPSTSTSCNTACVSGRGTRTTSLAPQTRRPTVTTCPVVKSTVTVTRRRTSTKVVATISTRLVTRSAPAVTQTVTPTVFAVSVPVVTAQAPAFTPTQTDFTVQPSPGTFTSTSTTFTNPPGPTLPVALPPRAISDEEEEDDDVEERDNGFSLPEESVLDRRTAKRITPANVASEVRLLKGREVYCRRIVRLDPKTVAGTRTRTATVSTTVRPRTTITSTVTAVATSTVFNSAANVLITAAPTTSTIVAIPITVTSTSTAATVTVTSTILTPQPTVVVPLLRNVFCGPRARFYNSDLIGTLNGDNQQLNAVPRNAGQTCCDAAADMPGAVGFADFGAGNCLLVRITAAPLEQFCVAGNPATGLLTNAGGCDPANCAIGGLLQCGA